MAGEERRRIIGTPSEIGDIGSIPLLDMPPVMNQRLAFLTDKANMADAKRKGSTDVNKAPSQRGTTDLSSFVLFDA
jgi:hypothetical protein